MYIGSGPGTPISGAVGSSVINIASSIPGYVIAGVAVVVIMIIIAIVVGRKRCTAAGSKVNKSAGITVNLAGDDSNKTPYYNSLTSCNRCYIYKQLIAACTRAESYDT